MQPPGRHYDRPFLYAHSPAHPNPIGKASVHLSVPDSVPSLRKSAHVVKVLALAVLIGRLRLPIDRVELTWNFRNLIVPVNNTQAQSTCHLISLPFIRSYTLWMLTYPVNQWEMSKFIGTLSVLTKPSLWMTVERASSSRHRYFGSVRDFDR